MADEVKQDKSKKNIKALREFRLNGKAVIKGEVIAKSDFQNSGDYLNLCAMTPARAEQTDEKVGKPAKKAADKLPGAK